MSTPPSTHPLPDSGLAVTPESIPSESGALKGGDYAGFATAFTVVVVLSIHNGSYFSTSWGWQALAFLVLAATGLIFMLSVRVFRLQLLFFSGVTAFVGWVSLSTLWSQSVPASVREIERDIVYFSLALALTVFGRYFTARGLAVGLLAGISAIAAYGLTTRLFPEHFATPDPTFEYRLALPLGYWNGLGLFAAMGLILAVGVAGAASTRVLRMAAGAASCVIAPTMLFTFSRGAWVAAAIGLIVMIALDSRRIALTAAVAALLAPVGCAVWLGATSRPLTDSHASVAEAAHAGRRYALAIVFLACLAALLVELAHRVVVKLGPGLRAERRFGVSLAAVALVAVCSLMVAYGGPVKAVDRSWAAFSNGSKVQPDNLSDRFRSLSNNGRAENWRVAVEDYRAHPVLGSGAGTYEQVWYRLRTIDLIVRDAHSLYLEALGELGPVGLLLLLATMAIPFVGFVRSRSVPYVPAAAGSFTAFAAHAGIDWDWEVVGLTATAILVATVGLVAAGERDRQLLLGRRVRAATVAIALAVAAFAYLSFAGNREVAASRRSLSNGDTQAALQSATRAKRTLRWSIEPWLALGDAQQALGDTVGARASFEHATVQDPDNWRAWLALSEVSVGADRRASVERAHRLNPREVDPSAP